MDENFNQMIKYRAVRNQGQKKWKIETFDTKTDKYSYLKYTSPESSKNKDAEFNDKESAEECIRWNYIGEETDIGEQGEWIYK